jgi:hypothetical protein
MIKSMKISKGPIGNQTRDLPACSAVLQPTAPQRILPYKKKGQKFASCDGISSTAFTHFAPINKTVLKVSATDGR